MTQSIFLDCRLKISPTSDTKQAAQTDSKSMIREPDTGHEVHGEVEFMCGASASRH